MSSTLKKLPQPHFDYLVGLKWEVSTEHDYCLTPVSKAVGLTATVDSTLLGTASTIDHFIWDEMVNNLMPSKWCESLTMWTRDLEFNLLVFGKNDEVLKLRCAYFPAPTEKVCEEHLRYWKSIKIKRSSPIDSDDANTIRDSVPKLVLWNRHELTAFDSVTRKAQFKRIHAYTPDCFRELFQTIPVPTKFLDYHHTSGSNAIDKANLLYRKVLEKYEFFSACGSPMKRNLLTLASLLADANIRVALVTGEPGTGKEAFSKAIYYGNKANQPARTDPQAVLLQTTAVEIQSAMKSEKSEPPTSFLKKKLLNRMEELGASRFSINPFTSRQKPKQPVILIDELNKAESRFLSALLRPLEQGEDELETDGKPKFILAASQHIDELAKKPPQDFWTRISHQLRVAHPLSRVSDEDAETFLHSFFCSAWWASVEEMIRCVKKEEQQDLVAVFFGSQVKADTIDLSPLCKRVLEEFLNTLVPLVSRDTLSVRGARSILSQVFARLSWFARFQMPLSTAPLSEETENRVARLVNSAVQDVLAILNAARTTPSGLEEAKEP